MATERRLSINPGDLRVVPHRVGSKDKVFGDALGRAKCRNCGSTRAELEGDWQKGFSCTNEVQCRRRGRG